MYLKRHVRTKDGKRHVYYSLTESIRLSRRRVRQRRVLNLGELNTTQIEQWQRSIDVLEETGQRLQRREQPLSQWRARRPMSAKSCSVP
jgi:hypothetical protein